MFRKNIFTVILLWVTVLVKAQSTSFFIKGMIKDDSGLAIAGATVSLMQMPAGKLLQQTISTDSGQFAFSVPPGQYTINITRVGFNPYHSSVIHLDDPLQPSTAMNIVLKKTIGTLQEVTVSAEKKRLEVSGNKLVLNVQNSALTAGASALEVLKTLPGVSVGQDDNILLRGSSGVNVMLDGKMTYVSGKELAQLLKGISAENISKIELIASPSAEFDASGNTGVINIMTKKNLPKGYAIDLRAGISKGMYWMTNENITASIRTRKLSLNGALDYNTPHRYFNSSSGNTVSENDQEILIRRKNETSYKIKFYTYRIGAEWQLSPRHQLVAGYSGYKDDFRAPKFSSITKYDQQEIPLSVLKTTTQIIEPYYYDAANVGYQFQIDSTGKKLTADAHYIAYRNYSDGLMTAEPYDLEGNKTGEDQALRFSQPGFIKIQSYKVDGDLPFGSLQIKAGLKYSRVTNDNNYQYDSLLEGRFVPAPSMSNHFKYQEEIAAGYFSVAKKIQQTTISAGLRVEHTTAKGYTIKEAVNNQWEYTKLFPSFSIDHTINANNKITLSGSRRIERPSYASLNPVRWYNDPYFFYAGNSDLKPEMGWLFAMAYTFRQRYILTINYSRRTDFLSRRLLPEPGTNALMSQMTNFNRLDRIDAQLSIPYTILNGWQLQWNAGLNYMSYPIGQLHQDKQLSQWAGNMQLQQQIKLPGQVHLEIAAYWYSKELMGIYKRSSFFFVDAGCKRSFFRNKLDARFSFSDLFGTNHYRAYSLSDHTNYFFHDRPDFRRAGLSLTYHFGGKLQNSQSRRIEEQDRL